MSSRRHKELTKHLNSLYRRMATERTNLDPDYLEAGIIQIQREIAKHEELTGALSLCDSDKTGRLTLRR